MTYTSQKNALTKLKTDCLVLPLLQGAPKDNPHLRELPHEIIAQIETLFVNEIIIGKDGQKYFLKTEGNTAFPFILLIGIGESKGAGYDCARKFGGNTASAMKGKKFKDVTVFVSPAFGSPKAASMAAQNIVEGIELGSYELSQYKSKPEKKSFPENFTFIIPSKWNALEFNSGLKVGEIMAWGQNLSRDLIGHPSNYLTPRELAKTAKSLAGKFGFECEVLSEAAIKKLKMDCLLGVNSGSEKPPHFIIMKYKGPRAKKDPVCLVGKGITFDAGGISLKPAQDMDQMKGDMGGAACVIASMACAARLKLPVNLIGLVPTTENLPSGSAYKPGDVLTAMNGKTVEIINTDAEGRLILADALSYAQKFEPAAIVDIATLTGAATIALGHFAAGLFVNDSKMRKLFKKASDSSSERVWEMPLWDEYQDSIKSSIADIKNSAGRPGSFCTAAAFLNNFTGDYPWAHIDMAAMDIEFKGGAYRPKGASGYGVRLMVEFLRNWQ